MLAPAQPSIPPREGAGMRLTVLAYYSTFSPPRLSSLLPHLTQIQPM